MLISLLHHPPLLSGSTLFHTYFSAKSSGRAPRVLVDLIHAPENNPEDYNHNKCNYEYYNNYSAFRLFKHLTRSGFEYSCVRKGVLTSALLNSFDILFINLIHEAQPHFLPQELTAVHNWVEQGGGLMVICEHTNAYHSAEKINPLITPLGLTVQWTAALDIPEFCTMPPGWILVRHVDKSHPVNKNVTTLHMKSAATIKAHEGTLFDSQNRPPQSAGIAFLSAEGWADEAGDNPPDFYGDGVYNEGDEKGHLPVIGVSEFGRGRVMVVGDQNMHGDAWLYFRHNFRQAMNAFEWLVEPSLTRKVNPCTLNAKGELANSTVETKIGVDTRFNSCSVAKQGRSDYFSFYCNLNRDHDVMAMAVSFGERELASTEHGDGVCSAYGDYDDDGCAGLDVMILPSPSSAIPQQDILNIQDMIWGGKTVVVLLDPSDISKHAIEFIHALVPKFSFIMGSTTFTLGSMTKKERDNFPARLKSTKKMPRKVMRLHSPTAGMDVRHLQIQDVQLSDVGSSWGQPFLQATLAEFDAALACSVTQSSEFDAIWHPASAAVDNNATTCTHTAVFDTSPWIEVDLGSEVCVSRIVLFNRVDGAQHRFRDLRVELFGVEREARSQPVFCSDLLNPDNQLGCPTHLTIDVKSVAARFVRVSRKVSTDSSLDAADQNVLSLAMVQVIAPVTAFDLPLHNAVTADCVVTQSSQEGQQTKNRTRIIKNIFL